MKITLRLLICEGGLGYCCPWIFYSRYKSTSLIAARLGVSIRAVEYGVTKFRKGEYQCEHKTNCMIRVIRQPRLVPMGRLGLSLPPLGDDNASDQTGLQTGPEAEEAE